MAEKISAPQQVTAAPADRSDLVGASNAIA